jgi:hypothetical protein
LLSSSIVVSENERWQGGFSHEPESCGTPNIGIYDPCESPTRTVDENSDGLQDVEPFIVWAGESCTSIGSLHREWKPRAERKLIACESNQIESELWRGDLSIARGWGNKRLASLDSDVLTDTATTPVRALSCLEQALAGCNCGGRGMIHAMPQIITLWSENGLVRREGNLLLTAMDTIVVPGSGYDGSGPPPSADAAPTPAADGSIWAYATGMVHIRLDTINVIPDSFDAALNRSTNKITFIAERLVSATWDCCHFAVELDVDLCGIGGPGS